MFVSKESNCYRIEFRFANYLLAAVKALPQRRWDDDKKSWVVPLECEANIKEFMRKYRFQWKPQGQPKEQQYENPPMPELTQAIPLDREPYPYQKQGIAYALRQKKCIMGDKPGLGKAQPLTSKIATPNGFVEMGQILIGSKVIDSNGNLCEVIGVYPQGIRPVYRVTLNDGTSTECDMEHLWCVRDSNRRVRGKGWSVKTLAEIMSFGLEHKPSEQRTNSGRKPVLKWQLPICDKVEYPEKDFVIHPYIFGLMLGDGYLCGEQMCISIPDAEYETVKRIEKLLPESLRVTTNRHPACPQYFLSQRKKTTNKNPYKREVERLGVNVKGKSKFIPSEYLYASIEQRMELLKGLMDSDGSAKNNRITFHTCSKQLAYGLSELVQSLGGQTIIREYNREAECKSMEWQVNVRVDFCPFKIERKVAQWSLAKRNKATRYIKSVEYVGDKECQCIKVSAPNSLYLTDNYIVTHNTGQAIAAVVGANAYPCLIICPSSLKINWQREVDIWTGGRHRAVIMGDDNRKTWHTFHDCGAIDMFGQNSKVDFFIVNYESLSKFFVSNIKKRIGKDGKDAPLRVTDIEFLPYKDMFRSIVIDESHRCKNGATKQSKFCMGICKGKEYVYLLTGTPVVNKPKDLVAQLHIMDMLPAFGGYKTFIDRYCSGTKEASNLSELNYRLRTMCFYQREKKDVLKDLPSKIRQTVICEINSRREYLAAEDNMIDYLRRYRDASDEKIARALKGQAMVLIGILRQISAKGKIDAVKEFTDNLVQAGEKVILFVSLHEIVDALKHIYPKAVTVTGRDDMDSRQRAVDNFQRDPKCNIIICSIKAAGTGLTLTASSNVGFVEFPWTYADCEQCEDRAHRIGQLSSVTASYFLGKNTIDEKIYQIIQTKKDIANAATGVTEQIEEATIDMITNLFSSRL